jgi:hypothetical protein
MGKRLQPTAIEGKAQNCYNKEKSTQNPMPEKSPAEHVDEQIVKGEKKLSLDREHVKKLAKEEAERLKLKVVIQKASAEQRHSLAEKIEEHQRTSDPEKKDLTLNEDEDKTVETLKTEIKGGAPPKPAEVQKNFLEKTLDTVEHYAQIVGDYISPVTDRLQEFFSGPIGKMWTMMGFEIPPFAKPGAVELKQLRRMLRNDASLKGIRLEEGDDKAKNTAQMSILRKMFGKNKSEPGAPQTIQDFLKPVLLEMKKGKVDEEDLTVTMEEIVDEAKTMYPKAADKVEGKDKEKEKDKEKDKDKKQDGKDPKKNTEKPEDKN